ncbi:hypothetical protein A2U01_0093168, partial [Trifolium medium]|nr:hypothetical protein [Trifolium medium]
CAARSVVAVVVVFVLLSALRAGGGAPHAEHCWVGLTFVDF